MMRKQKPIVTLMILGIVVGFTGLFLFDNHEQDANLSFENLFRFILIITVLAWGGTGVVGLVGYLKSDLRAHRLGSAFTKGLLIGFVVCLCGVGILYFIHPMIFK